MQKRNDEFSNPKNLNHYFGLKKMYKQSAMY